MAAHTRVSLNLNISSELIISRNSHINTINCVGVLVWLHIIYYIVALIYLPLAFPGFRCIIPVISLHFLEPCTIIVPSRSINKIVGTSRIKANDEQEGIKEDELVNSLPDNISPHHWSKDRILARIGSLVKKGLGWFLSC